MMSITRLATSLDYAADKRGGKPLKAIFVEDSHYAFLYHEMAEWKLKNNQPEPIENLGRLFIRGVEVFKNSDVLDLLDDPE